MWEDGTYCNNLTDQLPSTSLFCVSRMWADVTHNLKVNNIDAATDAKARLEQRQRKEAALRLETKSKWDPHFFMENGGSYPYRWPLIGRFNAETVEPMEVPATPSLNSKCSSPTSCEGETSIAVDFS